MAELRVQAGECDKVKALAFTGRERAALVLAVSTALDQRARKDHFPTAEDVRMLRRLGRRLWASVGVRS